ncbi:MAG: hypothetical protein HQ567_13480 [Candidatus Nealsonbacteria bacterium]|nr:hypothetical protein [Candidatus Nealsonbacteria bacterium]
MPRAKSDGTCQFCEQTLGKAQMTRHLNACRVRAEAIGLEEKPRTARRILHLTVEGRYAPVYWLHVETSADSRFGALDGFLREVWLECCGHLSDFRFPRPKPTRGGSLPTVASGDLWETLQQAFGSAETDDTGGIMDVSLGERLKKGDAFFHEYDFGSTTELKIKVVGQRAGNMRKDQINLLARNRPPQILCDCGKPATVVCTECSWDDEGWLCDACARQHDCDEEMRLPVVNSPRTGVCGYTG